MYMSGKSKMNRNKNRHLLKMKFSFKRVALIKHDWQQDDILSINGFITSNLAFENVLRSNEMFKCIR